MSKVIAVFFVFCLLSVPCANAESTILIKPIDARLEGIEFNEVIFSESETEWLKNNATIRVGGPRAFPPFYYYKADEQLVKGMAFDYLLLLSSLLNVEFEIHAGLPWSDVLNRIRSGGLDLISCAAISEERKAFLNFSDPYLSFPLVIISRLDAPFIDNIENLQGQRVACIPGNISCEWLDQRDLDYDAVVTKTPLDSLKKLSSGLADYYVGNLAASSFLIRKHGLTNLKIAAHTDFDQYQLAFAGRKDWPMLVSVLNKALQAIPESEHSKIKNQSIAVRYEHGVRMKDILQTAALIVIIALVIVGAILYWNRRLAKEIKTRILAESNLKTERDFSNAILTWISSIVVVIDLNGIIVRINNAGEVCSGYRLEELNSRPFWDILISDDQREDVRNTIMDVKNQGLPNEFENYWVTKSGEKRLIHWYNSILYTADGEMEYILCTGQDITEQRNAEIAQYKNEERLKLALQASHASAWEWDTESGSVYMGPTICAILHYPPDEEVRSFQDLKEIIRPTILSEIRHKLVDSEEKPTGPLSYEYRIKTRLGDWRWFRVFANASQQEANAIVHGTILDITEVKRNEEIVIQSEKMMSIGGLAAGMAHELNNPLGGILTGIQNIFRRLSNDHPKNLQAASETGIDLMKLQQYLEYRNVDKYLEGIQDCGKRAADIIVNMLSFAKKGEMKFDYEDLSSIVNRSLQLAQNSYDFSQKIDFKKIKIGIDIHHDVPAIYCIKNELEQVLLNLFKNAAQAMADNQHQVNPEITVEAVRENGWVKLSISDSGPGMEEALRKRIFEPFFTTKSEKEGTGLGLSVSYMIITSNHKGVMEVDSEPGSGTTFIIRLPLDTGNLV